MWYLRYKYILTAKIEGLKLVDEVVGTDCSNMVRVRRGLGHGMIAHIRRPAVGRRTWRDTLEWRAGTSAYRQVPSSVGGQK